MIISFFKWFIIYLFSVNIKPPRHRFGFSLTWGWQYLLRPSGKKNRSFKKRSRKIHMPSVSNPINCSILGISGPRIWNQKSPEWCSFWGHKLPGNVYFWSHKLVDRSFMPPLPPPWEPQKNMPWGVMASFPPSII